MTSSACRRRAGLLALTIALGLLTACAHAPNAADAPLTAAAQPPDTITAHLDGRASYYVGVSGSP